MAARSGGLAAAAGIDESRDQPWARLLWVPTSTAAPVGAGRWPGTWPSCSPRTPRAGRACCTPGRGPRRRLGRPPLGPDRAWQAELWRRLRAAMDAPEPAERMAAAVRALRERPPRTSTCRPGCRCSVPPGWSPTTWSCWPGSPPPATSPLAARAVAGPVAEGGRPPGAGRGRRPAADGSTTPRGSAVIGCWPISAGTRGSCSSRWPPPTRTSWTSTCPGRRRRPTTLLGWLQADIAADREPQPEVARPVLDPADRSVQVHAATDRTARSRCCARSWSGCWPTTRHSSRGTSS